MVVRRPRFTRFDQLFGVELLGDSETQEGRDDARGNVAVFLKPTWLGNSGAHDAEMMALTIAREIRVLGRFFVLQDRSDAGKKTRDVAMSYCLCASDSSGKSSMSGTLRADWICKKKCVTIRWTPHHTLKVHFRA